MLVLSSTWSERNVLPNKLYTFWKDRIMNMYTR